MAGEDLGMGVDRSTSSNRSLLFSEMTHQSGGRVTSSASWGSLRSSMTSCTLSRPGRGGRYEQVPAAGRENGLSGAAVDRAAVSAPAVVQAAARLRRHVTMSSLSSSSAWVARGL